MASRGGKNNDGGDKHDDAPYIDNHGKPVETDTSKEDKRANQAKDSKKR